MCEKKCQEKIIFNTGTVNQKDLLFFCSKSDIKATV